MRACSLCYMSVSLALQSCAHKCSELHSTRCIPSRAWQTEASLRPAGKSKSAHLEALEQRPHGALQDLLVRQLCRHIIRRPAVPPAPIPESSCHHYNPHACRTCAGHAELSCCVMHGCMYGRILQLHVRQASLHAGGQNRAACLLPGLKAERESEASVIMSCGLEVPRKAITASRASIQSRPLGLSMISPTLASSSHPAIAGPSAVRSIRAPRA